MRVRRGFQGALLGLGAPLGWLAWRVARYGVDPLAELAAHADLYLYMTVGTVVSFALFALRISESETDLRRENVDLSTQAVTDGLTGLRNKRFFHARLAEAVAEATRHAEPLSLIVFDLDHFKRVNDTYGHRAGDEVLAELANRVHGIVRAADTAARVGGEEFAILLPKASLEAAQRTAERVRHAVEAAAFHTTAGDLTVTISAGVAELEGTSPDEIFSHADAALYRAKRGGRNCVVTHASRAEEVAVDRAVR